MRLLAESEATFSLSFIQELRKLTSHLLVVLVYQLMLGQTLKIPIDCCLKRWHGEAFIITVASQINVESSKSMNRE